MNNAVVTFSDAAQWHRAKRTIEDIRGPGRWWGPLVYMAAAHPNGEPFEPPRDFIDLYEVTVHPTNRVDTTALEKKLSEHPFSSGDGRERTKTIQWTKLRLFEPWITTYERVFYVDAGFRIFNNLSFVFTALQQGKLLALDDAHPFDESPAKTFGCQLEPISNPAAFEALLQRFPGALRASYFLNCAFVFDTEIVLPDTFAELLDVMHTYPIFRTNEMGAMNVHFHLDRALWQKLPTEPVPMWDWTERGQRTFRDYVGLKYPRKI